MPTRRRGDVDLDSDLEQSWGEGSYIAPVSDADSTDDSDQESTRTSDLSESEESIQSPSGSDSDLDLEEIQREIRTLRFPYQHNPSKESKSRPRFNQTRASRKVIDLRSPSPDNVIEISSDSDSGSSSEDDSVVIRRKLQCRSRLQGQKAKLPAVTAGRPALTKPKRRRHIILSSEDEESELDVAAPAPQSRDRGFGITKPRNKISAVHQSPHETTFLPRKDFVELTKHRFGSEELKTGVTVERIGMSSSGERSAFVIFRLLQDLKNRRIYVEGRRLVFTSTFPRVDDSPLGGANEVTAVFVECEADSCSTKDHERFPVDEVKRIWKLKFVSTSQSLATSQENITAGELVCRSVLILKYKSREAWTKDGTQIAGALRPLRPEEYDNTIRPTYNQSAKSVQDYTFIDICASIGGASEAAKMAGLKITHAVERDGVRAGIYSLNFRDQETKIHIVDLLDLPPELDLSQWHAAVLHFSMSCKYWSQAHTVEGKDDQSNRALLHEIPKLIARIQPRQVTVEQVPGLIKMRDHRADWLKLVFAIATLGYSFQWKIIKLEELGGYATRERLIMLASAPGEAMPPWPKTTHGDGPGLAPFITAKEALSNLSPPRRTEPSSAKMLGRPVLCDPGKLFPWTLVGNRHPTRKIHGYTHIVLHWENRPFTLQELARLQGLLQDRQWAGSETEKAKMIGDAVPVPPFVKILKQVINTLKASDSGHGSIARSPYDEPFLIMPSTTSSTLLDHIVQGSSSRKRSAQAPEAAIPRKKQLFLVRSRTPESGVSDGPSDSTTTTIL
ncbi:RIP defective [Venturia nashicola]|nr:RIP defective [Venturia nashicola]